MTSAQEDAFFPGRVRFPASGRPKTICIVYDECAAPPGTFRAPDRNHRRCIFQGLLLWYNEVGNKDRRRVPITQRPERMSMPLTLAPLFSSSKGNSTYVASGQAQILIDAGVHQDRLIEEMAQAGGRPKELSGILVTHEHSDHIRSVGVISRMYDVPVYANDATWQAMDKKIGQIAPKNMRVISPSEDFYVGDLCIQPIPTSHDAACSCGYSVTCGQSKISVVTDLGYMTADILDAAARSRIILLESNYDPEMLQNGKYPAFLKRRIASGKGHLSNFDAAKAAEQLYIRGVRGILLAHLSENNNMYQLALSTTSDYLKSLGIERGRHIALDVAQRSGLTGVFRV